jgi:hypothetical protein
MLSREAFEDLLAADRPRAGLLLAAEKLSQWLEAGTAAAVRGLAGWVRSGIDLADDAQLAGLWETLAEPDDPAGPWVATWLADTGAALTLAQAGEDDAAFARRVAAQAPVPEGVVRAAVQTGRSRAVADAGG